MSLITLVVRFSLLFSRDCERICHDGIVMFETVTKFVMRDVAKKTLAIRCVDIILQTSPPRFPSIRRSASNKKQHAAMGCNIA